MFAFYVCGKDIDGQINRCPTSPLASGAFLGAASERNHF